MELLLVGTATTETKSPLTFVHQFLGGSIQLPGKPEEGPVRRWRRRHDWLLRSLIATLAPWPFRAPSSLTHSIHCRPWKDLPVSIILRLVFLGSSCLASRLPSPTGIWLFISSLHAMMTDEFPQRRLNHGGAVGRHKSELSRHIKPRRETTSLGS